jgi:hypothetical protein
MSKSFSGLGATTGLAADRISMTGMSAGQQFFDTDTKRVLIYDGSSWVVVAGKNVLMTSPIEKVVVDGGLSGVYNFDVKASSVVYASAAAVGNWTLNVRGDESTTLNSLLGVNQAITMALIAQQGDTAFYQSAMTIDGTSVTPKWSGGTAPTSGNASSNDVYTFTILKTASTPTYVVLASVTKWGL